MATIVIERVQFKNFKNTLKNFHEVLIKINLFSEFFGTFFPKTFFGVTHEGDTNILYYF